MISTSRFLALGALATAGSVLALSAGAQSISMSVVTGSPPGHIISDGGVEPWMACVTDALGDEIEFNYFPAGQLVALRELQSGLENGIANAVPIPVGYASDRLPLNNVSMLPGLGTSAQQIIGSYSRLIREDEAIAAEFAEINAVPIWAMGFPPYQIISTGPAMRTLADFTGSSPAMVSRIWSISISKELEGKSTGTTSRISCARSCPAPSMAIRLTMNSGRCSIEARTSATNRLSASRRFWSAMNPLASARVTQNGTPMRRAMRMPGVSIQRWKR